jgi:hypothetical protein
MKVQCLFLLAAIFFLLSCKGPAGPMGPSGADALTDPNIKPKVIWTFPSNGQIGPITDFYSRVSIRFNKILDASTIYHSIQLSPSNTGYARVDTNNTLSFTGDIISVGLYSDSSYMWAVGQKYTSIVLTTLKDINGNSLSAPYSFSFTPEPYFRVTYTYPTNGATAVLLTQGIQLEFNNNIDFSTFQSSISVSPVVSGNWILGGNNYVYLQMSTQYSPSTVYVVTLGTGMRDAQGRSLSSPFTFSFTTAGGAVSPQSSTVFGWVERSDDLNKVPNALVYDTRGNAADTTDFDGSFKLTYQLMANYLATIVASRPTFGNDTVNFSLAPGANDTLPRILILKAGSSSQ